MKIIEIQGNKPLSGTIKVSGAKNSAVALIPAAILCDEEVVIENIPDISDTYDLFNILEVLNVKKEYDKPILKLDLRNIRNTIQCSKRRNTTISRRTTITKGFCRDKRTIFKGNW